MNCDKNREKLSAYIDGMLTPDEKALLEEHLRSCSACSAVLTDMIKTIGHVKGMEEVEPPTWLTQKIMARVRLEAEPEKSILQKLFSPFYIKVPIGAVATIAIALTTIYIFKAIQPEIQFAKIPSEETGMRAPSSPDANKKTQMPLDVTARAEAPKPVISRDEASSSKDGYVQGGKQTEETSVLGETKIAPAKPAEMPVVSLEPQTAGKALEVQKAPSPVMKEYRSMPSPGSGVMDSMKQEAAQLKEKKLVYKSVSQGMEEKTSKKITFTTDRKIYIQGNEVHITAVNISEQDASIVDRKFIDAGFARIEIMTPEGNWKGIELYTSANVITNRTLKPRESHVYLWKTSGYNRPDTMAAPGVYRICFNDKTCTDSFEIKGK